MDVCADELLLADGAGVGEELSAGPVLAGERVYDCCEVERVRGWIGGTVMVTVVHEAGCPVWSAR